MCPDLEKNILLSVFDYFQRISCATLHKCVWLVSLRRWSIRTETDYVGNASSAMEAVTLS